MTAVRVSVVLPTWNRAAPLRESIASVLAQTFTDFELIVVDDGSTDDTADVVAALHDPRVRYVKQDGRGGVSRARNRGVELARAPWIAFQDSDDRWRPRKLQRQLDAATDRVALVVTRDRVVDDPALSFGGVTAAADVTDITDQATFRLPPAATWLVRREAILAAGAFDESLNCYEDWELALRLPTGGRIVLVDEILVERSKTPGSLFSDEASRLESLRTIVERHQARLRRDPRAWSYYCNAIGQMTAQAGNLPVARRWFFEAWRARPISARSAANVLLSYGGPAIFSTYVSAARRIKSRARRPG